MKLDIKLLKKTTMTKNKENAKTFMNFLTGYQVQYMISQNLERRSVRNDIPEALELPLKKEITMRYANNKEVLEKKEEWIML